MSFFSNLAQIASSVLGGLAAIIGLYYKYIYLPDKKFRTETNAMLQKIQIQLSIFEQKQKDTSEDSDVDKKNLEERLMREIDDIKEDQKELSDNMNRHIDAAERKNEKLMDIIIRYFSDRE